MRLICTAEVQEDGFLCLPQIVVKHLGLSSSDEVGFYEQADKIYIQRQSEIRIKTAEYYRAKGYDILAAEYLASPRKMITAVETLAPYRLLLTYEGNEQRLMDCGSLIAEGGAYKPLRDERLFQNPICDDGRSVYWRTNLLQQDTESFSDRIELTADECYLLSIPAIVEDLTREEMIKAKEYAIRIGFQIVDETMLAGFCVGIRKLGIKT